MHSAVRVIINFPGDWTLLPENDHKCHAPIVEIGWLSRLAETQGASLAFSHSEHKKRKKKKFATISAFFSKHLEYSAFFSEHLEYFHFFQCTPRILWLLQMAYFKKDKLECVQRRTTRIVSVLENTRAVHHVLLINISVMGANPIREQRELTLGGIMPYGSSKYSWLKSQNTKNI